MTRADEGALLPVVVVGAGIAGVACARVLHDAGVPVRVLDRGRRVGGRMATRTEHFPVAPRPVDIGASYFTVREDAFAAVVADWQSRGLARPWTDTFALAGPTGRAGSRSGPLRWAALSGLRSLVEDLAAPLAVIGEHEVAEVGLDADGHPRVDGERAAAVVLAMPDPQAADLLPVALSAELELAPDWNPVISVWAGWSRRWWPPVRGMFVEDSAVLAWVADDGDRRGDDAPVLVLHTTPLYAAAHLDAPGDVVPALLEELGVAMGVAATPAPEFVRAKRWSLASPRSLHPSAFGLHETPSGGVVAVCGDGWGPRPRVEQAWLSGHELGRELLHRLSPASRPGSGTTR